MHSNNDILDVPDGQSSAGVLGSRDNSSNVDGPRNSLHHGWNRESLLGRSYRDVREAVAANTLPNYSALASIPSSHSRDNTLSREIHHFTVRDTTFKFLQRLNVLPIILFRKWLLELELHFFNRIVT